MSNIELKGLKGLQGLDNLLQEVKTESVAKENIYSLPISSFIPGKYQPRSSMDSEALNELAASIKMDGVIQPLIVRRLEKDKYEIIAGERRWQASKIAGLTTVPAIIRDVPNETALAFALIENIQRESLNPIDEAGSLVRLKDEFGMTHEEIAERVGRSRSTVTNLMRLVVLDESIKNLLRLKKLEMGHARALLPLAPNRQLEVANVIVEKGLSVRETEKVVQKLKQPTINLPITKPFQEKIDNWEELLADLISLQVRINLSQKGNGKIVIQVTNPNEIEWLIKTIREGLR